MAVTPVKEESAAANAADAALQGAAVAAAAEPERKRRHKWGPPAAGEFAREEQRPKKRRSRWESNTDIVVATSNSGQIIIPGQLPKEVTICGGMKIVLASGGTVVHANPQLQQLHERLNELNRKITAGELDIPPEHERSPSPEPVYDSNGIRLNTREIRAREKLVERRNRLIEDVIKHDPEYKPPSDYRPRKFSSKIYIPINEYPGYNFIGLIIGPRGNTQKRMQRETNCKIAIRGRGSLKEGISKDPKYDYGEDEELHVLVTGENQADVDRASAMIEKLCTPSDDDHNEHKKLQLRELAALNGTLKEVTECYHCGMDGHTPEMCPNKDLDVYKLPEQIGRQVTEQYERDVARVHGGEVEDSQAEYRKFMSGLGGAPPPELMGLDAHGQHRREQLPDDCKLYVGNLPQAYDSNMLRQLFAPHAEVVHSAVITEPGSNMSRGFGFVHIPDPVKAKEVRDLIHGTVIDGRAIVVRLKTEKGQRDDRGPREGGRGPPVRGEVEEHKLYVAGLTPTVQEHALRDIFGRFGDITQVHIVRDPSSNMCKGFCFISFDNKEQAGQALEGMHGYKLDGKPLIVKIAGQRDPPRHRSGLGYDRDRDRDHREDHREEHRGHHGHHGHYGQPPPPGGGPPPGYAAPAWGPHPPGPYPGAPYQQGPPYGDPHYGAPAAWGAPPPQYGAPPPPWAYPGGVAPPWAGGYGDPAAAAYGGYGAAPPPPGGGYPPAAAPYGAPPPLPPGAPPPLPAGAPPPLPSDPAHGGGDPAAAAAAGYAPWQQHQPPAPSPSAAAPPPAYGAPPPQQPPQQQQPAGGNTQSEYEKFMQELTSRGG
jgi:splicing factor 1